MKILQHRKIIKCVKYVRVFNYKNDSNGGFAFPSDENGNVKIDELKPVARDNYEKCISGEYNVIDKGLEVYSWNYTEPAIGECVCGAEVELFGFTNTCDRCERDYNSAGQQLAPRRFWGEETGESLADILRIK